MRYNNSALSRLEKNGIYPRSGFRGLINGNDDSDFSRMAMDELPYGMPLAPNNIGIPWQYLSYIDRVVIRAILAPLTAEQIFPLEVRGPWNTRTAQYTHLEHGGFIADYGDRSHEGGTSFNTHLPNLDFYMFQTIVSVGDLEDADFSSFGFSAMTEKEIAAADIINRALNYMAFFGVNGLNNWGIINNPYANASISVIPDPEAANPNTVLFSEMSALGLYNNVRALVMALTRQSMGRITARSKLVLSASPSVIVALETAANNYGLLSGDFISKAMPGLSFVAVPEFSEEVNGESEIINLVAPDFAARSTGTLLVNSRMKSHGPVRNISDIEEKKSAGSGGFMLHYPMGMATMIGSW